MVLQPTRPTFLPFRCYPGLRVSIASPFPIPHPAPLSDPPCEPLPAPSRAHLLRTPLRTAPACPASPPASTPQTASTAGAAGPSEPRPPHSMCPTGRRACRPQKRTPQTEGETCCPRRSAAAGAQTEAGQAPGPPRRYGPVYRRGAPPRQSRRGRRAAVGRKCRCAWMRRGWPGGEGCGGVRVWFGVRG